MSTDWMRGTGADGVQGAEADGAALIDDNISDYIQTPLDRLLANYRRGCLITYASATTVTVGVGEVVCASSAGYHRMRQNTAAVTVDISTNLDTGTEDVSTTYYIWAVADVDSGTTFTCKLSESATAPTGCTYYALLGSIYNNSSGDFETGRASDERMTIVTGTCVTGATIALPTGYIQDQCKWTVSIGSFSYGIGEGPSHPAIAATATVDSNRLVTISTGAPANASANYIIIGWK